MTRRAATITRVKTGVADVTTRVFRVAALVSAVHAVDDAFVHPGPGYGLGQHAVAGLLAIAAAAAAIVAFPRLRAGVQAALALSFGVLAVVNGGMHAGHLSAGGPSGGDFTGLLALAAGVVLIGLAAVLGWRGHTWRGRILAAPIIFVAGVMVLGPMAMGVSLTHKWREPVGEPPSAAYQDVTFQASDGLELKGWYRPSRNGAAVLVVHGGSSDRKGSVAHASMLARHGYGVLLYDARGRGESEGSENNYGSDWSKDVAGALAYLKTRGDVDPQRIAAVGLSTGADVLLDVVPRRDDIAALVTDGAAAGSFADWQNLRGTELGTVPGWVMFKTIHVLSGDAPTPGLDDAVRRLAKPTLLISAGTDIEREFNVHYDGLATGPVEHWNLADAHHTRAIHEYPREYEQRVIGFLVRALYGR